MPVCRWDANRSGAWITVTGAGNLNAQTANVPLQIGVCIDATTDTITLNNYTNMTTASFVIAGLFGGAPVFPVISLNATGGGSPSATIITTAPFAQLPDGYSGIGGVLGGVNPSITLSNGNLTATTSTGSWNSAIGTVGVNSGKSYFEVFVNAGSSGQISVGIGTAAQPNNTFAGADASYGGGWRNNGTNDGAFSSVAGSWTSLTGIGDLFDRSICGTVGIPISSGKSIFWEGLSYATQNLVAAGFATLITPLNHPLDGTAPPYTPLGANVAGGDVSGWFNYDRLAYESVNVSGSGNPGSNVACLMGLNLAVSPFTFWFFNHSTGLWNGSPTANPLTNVGGYACGAMAGTVFPAVSFQSQQATGVASGDAIKANFGASAFTNATQAAALIAGGWIPINDYNGSAASSSMYFAL